MAEEVEVTIGGVLAGSSRQRSFFSSPWQRSIFFGAPELDAETQGDQVPMPILDLWLPGAIWRRPRRYTNVPPFFGAPQGPPTPATLPGQGGRITLVPREVTADPRLRRHTEIVESILNSLILRGQVVQIAPGKWRILPPVLSVARAPLATDDETNASIQVGMFWIDTSAEQVYICISATEGSANWKLLG